MPAERGEVYMREREEEKDGGKMGRSFMLVFYAHGKDDHPAFTILNQRRLDTLTDLHGIRVTYG